MRRQPRIFASQNSFAFAEGWGEAATSTLTSKDALTQIIGKSGLMALKNSYGVIETIPTEETLCGWEQRKVRSEQKRKV